MKCIDMMVWIGQTYRTPEEYIQEAERRGCCRKIPGKPPWAEPGQTRVFLIHRDGRRPHQGSIFGYFVLSRLEVITPGPQFPHWPPLTQSEHEGLKKVKKRRDIKKRLEKHRRKYRQYVARRQTRPRPTPPDAEDDPLDEIFREWLKEVVREWAEGACQPVQDDFAQCEPHRSCSQRESPGSVYGVDPLALEIGTAYQKGLDDLVQECSRAGKDRAAVLADVGNEMQEAWRWWLRIRRARSRARVLAQLVEAEGPSRKWWKTVAAVDGGSALRHLHHTSMREWHWWRAESHLFQRIADTVLRERQRKTEIPECLHSKAVVRGELVVFKRPFPIFQQAPQAAFLGIKRIDGDELVCQIADGVRTPVISQCGEEIRDDEIETQSQLVARLSSKLHLSEAVARQCFKELAALAEANLLADRPFLLPDLGRLVVKYRSATTGRNPRTGETLPIPAKRVVRFRPRKALRDKIAPIPPIPPIRKKSP